MAPKSGEDIVDLTDSPSLRNSSWPPSQQHLQEDDEDEDLKLAIAMSLQQQEKERTTSNGYDLPVIDEISRASESTHEVPQQASSSGLFGLDRKAMEAERLARLKRKRGPEESALPVTFSGSRISPPPLRRNTGFSSQMKSTERASSASAKLAPAPTPPQSAKVSKASLTSQAPPSGTVQTYPQGDILKTYCPGYPTNDTISFPDLITPASQLQFCLLSSFIWDYDWLFPHFSTKTTNFLLVMHAKYPSQKSQITADFARIPNIKLCFPPMEGQVNCMHSKLMLLFYAERCRIVVPTANLMGFDWGVGSVMENMLWLIDLPLLTGSTQQAQTEFKTSIVAFLKAQGVPESVIGKLDRYDFANTHDTRFVHSIGGSHGEDTWQETGHCGLGKAVSSLGLATTEPIEVDFVTSSVGSLNEEFMRSIYVACQGDDGLTELTLRNAKTFPAKRVAGTSKELVQKDAGKDWQSRFRFYFPSHSTVETSDGGTGSAGTICFSRKWWENALFPKENMRDCVSVRPGLLMHNKIIFVRYISSGSGTERRCDGWAYIGSANLSESAWGRLVQNKSTKRPKLNCRNWECGVVVPMARKPSEDGKANLPTTMNSLNESVLSIPVPMLVSTESYQTSKKIPWFFGAD